MSKSVKRVLSVAAVVAIPFAAPAIAASSFMAPLAAKLGATATSALAGGALGAAKGAIFNEDIGQQALFGSLGAGIRQVGLNAQAAEAGANLGATAGAGGAAPATNYASAAEMLANPSSLTTVPSAAESAAATAGLAAPGTTAAQSAATASGIGTTASVSQTGPSFMEALKSVPAEIAAKYRDPKALADLTLRAAGMMTGSLAAGSGLSSQEEALLRAQRADLEAARQQNAQLFQLRLSEAQKLIGESAYFDPEYFGLQRARDAQRAGAYAKRSGLRGLSDERRDVAERQYDLGIARNVGTAYDSGYQTGVQGRLSTRAAGLSALPGGYPTMSGDYQSLMQAYSNASERKRQQQQDIGEFFDPLFDPNREREMDDDKPPTAG